MLKLFKRKTFLPQRVVGQVLLLIDWDNLFYGLSSRFGVREMHIEKRLEKLMEWINEELGELLGGYGFVFAPEHLTAIHQQMCVECGLKLITCPKRQLREPKRNEKSGRMVMEEDTVDETIIWFARMMVRHPDFRTICLVSGDNDYVPLFEELGHYGIKRALAPPTVDSLSRTRQLIDLVDRNPLTTKKMLFILDKIAV